MKQRVLALLLVLLVACGLCSAAAAPDLPSPTRSFYVNDFAGVIDQGDEQAMLAAGIKLAAACEAQVVVVTIPSLEGEAIETYSLQLARKWGIGDKEKDNGLLLLLSVEEPRVRIEVGSGLEGAIPDSKAGRILDTFMIPYYQPGSYSQGLLDTYNALVNEVYIEYGLEPQEGYIPLGDGESERKLTPLGIIFRILILIVVIVLFIRYPHLFWFVLHLLSRGGHSGGGGGGRHSGGGGGFSGGGASR